MSTMTGKELRKTRQSLGLTMQELGDMVSVTRAYIWKIENALSPIPDGIEPKLVRALRKVADQRTQAGLDILRR